MATTTTTTKYISFFIFSLVTPLSIPTQTQPNPALAEALPLSTSSRWIVDEKGKRVKLACANLVAHLEPAVAEGLSNRPMDAIAKAIGGMGFNCVRLTWPLFLFTNDTLGNTTVRQSFLGLGLNQSISGILENNPNFIDLPLLKAYQEVVSILGDNNVMVVLDNHVSKPGWCCSNSDGNGFFGDQYFDPDQWIKGLTKVATIFKGVSNVVGMSLRNELRGPKQNVPDWYRYMQEGAEAVHTANPDVLVILSGLSYDRDLSFLASRPVNLSFTGKVVFEYHWYGFSDGQAWTNGNPNQVCGSAMGNMMRTSGFLLAQGWPLFVSEFGVDMRGTNENDNRYLGCFMGIAAELDLDWALWSLVGGYYLREGVVGSIEYYGVLSSDWSGPRNSSFLHRISAIQSPFQGPGLSESDPHKVIFHPATGLCVLRKSRTEPMKLGSCEESETWKYTSENRVTLMGTHLCLQANELNKPADLSLNCTGSNSKWDIISDSKMHLSAMTFNREAACLDVDPDNNIIVSTCRCLSNDSMCDPETQWFKLVNSTRSSTMGKQVSNNLDYVSG